MFAFLLFQEHSWSCAFESRLKRSSSWSGSMRYSSNTQHTFLHLLQICAFLLNLNQIYKIPGFMDQSITYMVIYLVILQHKLRQTFIWRSNKLTEFSCWEASSLATDNKDIKLFLLYIPGIAYCDFLLFWIDGTTTTGNKAERTT